MGDHAAADRRRQGLLVQGGGRRFRDAGASRHRPRRPAVDEFRSDFGVVHGRDRSVPGRGGRARRGWRSRTGRPPGRPPGW